MPYVRKRKQGWQAVWKLPSGQHRTETRKGWTKQQALTFATEREQKAVRTPWASNPGDIPRFAEYAEVTTIVRQVKASTANRERSMWARINTVFGEWPINTIAPSDIRLFVESLIGEGLSPAYVRDIYGLIAMTFDYAVADEIITQTPCVKVILPKRKTKVVAADPDDVARIVEAIDPRYSVLVKFLAGTGARIGEALAVKVADLVDIPQPAVRISKSVTDDGELGTTKTSAGVRTVALPDWLNESLRHHITEYGLGPDDQLFPAPAGGVLPTRRFRARFWNPACQAAGVKVTAHQIRHLNASVLIDAGRPLPEIAARLGHENPSVTMQVYAHWLHDDDSGSAKVIPDYTQPKAANG
jgi:integrase